MNKLVLVFVICIVTFSVGCPRYDAVRRLSTEQLAVQASLRTNLTDYYNAMDKLLGQQAEASIAIIEIETRQQIDDRNQILSLDLGKATNRAERLEMARKASIAVEKYSNDAATKKQKIRERIATIKAKHAEIIVAYDAMYVAQQELDRYIQLKKVDEVVAEALINRFKINQDKLNKATVAATTATTELFDIIKK